MGHQCEHPEFQFLPLKASISLTLVNFFLQVFCGLGKGAAQQEPIAPRRMVRILANGEIVQDDDPV